MIVMSMAAIILHVVSLFLVLAGNPPKMQLTSRNIHEHQISLWCNSYPFAILYTKGRYVRCLDRSETSELLEKQTLKGVTLRVGILEGDHDHDFDCGVKQKGGKWVPNDDYTNHILKLLQEALQFEGTDSNGAALIRLLQSNTTDLTVCHWTTSDMILQSADHLRPTLQTTEAFVFVPSNLPLTQDVFLRTFSFQLWILFFLAICILVVSFKFSTYVHSRVRPDHEPWGWDEVILWAIATVSQQSSSDGYSRHPRGSSCRTMFLIGYTISFLLYTGFAAGITSLLALSGHRDWLSFNDVNSMKLKLLFHSDEYYFDFLENGLRASSAFANYFTNSEFEDLHGIFSKILNDHSVGYGATVSFVNYMKKINPSARDNYFIFPQPLYYRQKSFLVRKSFQHKELFNYWLLKFYETGLLDMGQKKFLKAHEENLYKTNPWLSADLGNVFSAIIFLIGGWIISILVLILEMSRWKKPRKPIKQKKPLSQLDYPLIFIN